MSQKMFYLLIIFTMIMVAIATLSEYGQVMG